MVINGDRISKPVSLSDISTVLGVNSLDLGTLCTSDKINIWSKHKPCRNTSFRELTETDRTYYNYSIDFPQCNNVVVCANTAPSHLKPRGKDYNEWFRILDFDGYIHSSSPSFIPLITNDSARIDWSDTSQDHYAYFGLNEGEVDSGILTISDLSGVFSDKYLAIVVKIGGLYYICTDKVTLAQEAEYSYGFEMTLPRLGFPIGASGRYVTFFVMVDNIANYGNGTRWVQISSGNATCFPLPFVSPQHATGEIYVNVVPYSDYAHIMGRSYVSTSTYIDVTIIWDMQPLNRNVKYYLVFDSDSSYLIWDKHIDITQSINSATGLSTTVRVNYADIFENGDYSYPCNCWVDMFVYPPNTTPDTAPGGYIYAVNSTQQCQDSYTRHEGDQTIWIGEPYSGQIIY